MDVTFMRRATAPVAMSGTAEDEDEGEEAEGGPAYIGPLVAVGSCYNTHSTHIFCSFAPFLVPLPELGGILYGEVTSE